MYSGHCLLAKNAHLLHVNEFGPFQAHGGPHTGNIIWPAWKHLLVQLSEPLLLTVDGKMLKSRFYFLKKFLQ